MGRCGGEEGGEGRGAEGGAEGRGRGRGGGGERRRRPPWAGGEVSPSPPVSPKTELAIPFLVKSNSFVMQKPKNLSALQKT